MTWIALGAGIFCGAILGVILMAILSAGSGAEDDSERLDFMQDNALIMSTSRKGDYWIVVGAADTSTMLGTGTKPREAIDSARLHLAGVSRG